MIKLFKYWIVLFVATQSIHTIPVPNFDNPKEIIESTDGAFLGAMNMVMVFDIMTCYKYSMVLFWNGVDTFKYILFDPWLAIESFGLMIHKSPLVYQQCHLILNDTAYLETTWQTFDNVTSENLWMHLSENFIYNLGDIFRNLIEGREYLAESNFTMYGQSIGQIVADLFFINPHDQLVWTEENSAVIFGAGQTYKIQSQFFNELEVQASRPKDVDFSLPKPDFFTKKKNKKYEAINRIIDAKPKL